MEAKPVLNIFIDVCCLIVVAIPAVVLEFGGVTPTRRGFFCDDDSIKYPHQSSTVPTSILFIGSLITSLVAIVAIELFTARRWCSSGGEWVSSKVQVTVNIYRWIGILVFGECVNLMVTDALKIFIGRLRPHFLAACRPDPSSYNCSSGYITTYDCTGSPSMVREARLSFPSGHTSFAVYVTTFLGLCLHARLNWTSHRHRLMRTIIHCILVVPMIFVITSRLFDNHHYGTDVLAGAIIGAVNAYIAVYYILIPDKATTDDESQILPIIQKSTEKPKSAND